MQLFQRIFFAAILAGIAAGLTLSAIQQWRVVPLIITAEAYEIGDVHALEHASDMVVAGPHLHPENDEPVAEQSQETLSEAAWAPQQGLERAAYTVLASVLTGLGFALLMGAASIFSGVAINSTNGILWGVAGFVTFTMMPAIGLPPELPGMVAADLFARQVWWVGTVVITGLAIYVFSKNYNPGGLFVAIVLILIPHIMGAPLPPDEPSNVPAALVLIYVANAIFCMLVFWLTLGFAFGLINQRNIDNGAQ